MIELVRMFEPIQKTEPQVVEPIQEIFEPIHDESKEADMKEEVASKKEITSESFEEEPIISTNELSTLTITNPDKLIPEKELEPIENTTNELETIQEDSCFICKNKKKQESKQLQFQQFEESIKEEIVADEQKNEVNFLSEILRQFQGLFGWVIFNWF